MTLESPPAGAVAPTSTWVEIRAGVTTFLTMAYILAVNPQILAATGMPEGDVFFATAVSAGAATLLMALWTRYPIALAPGMGINAYFAFSVVGAMGIAWSQALAAVFVEGVLFLVLSLTGVRTLVLEAVPRSVRSGTIAGIGLFLCFIGLQSAGWVVDHPATLVTMGDPSSAPFLLALGGLLLTAVLLQRQVRGGILIGILAVSALSMALGVSPLPQGWLRWPSLPEETLFAFGLADLRPDLTFVGVVLALFFVDLLGTAGTVVGVGSAAGLLDEKGQLPRSNRVFATDALGTSLGALLGTSTVTSYIESATGVRDGGRGRGTGVTVAVLFLASLFVAPLFLAVPAAATAPALVLVGAGMVGHLREVDWTRLDESLPAFLTAVTMAFTYSIANGLTLGIVSFVVLKLLVGRRREVHPALYVLAVMLVAFYAWWGRA